MDSLWSPSLPPEIWFDIFSFTVHVPGVLDTKWDYSPDDLIWEGVWSTTGRKKGSLQMRRAIVRVSREWYTAGRRLLYEDVVLGNLADVLKITTLCEQTGESRSEEGGNGGAGDLLPGCGRWVKRVSINGGNLLGETNFPDLERLLQQCVNIRILLLNAAIYNPSYVSRIFLSPSAPSLRRISVFWLPEGGQGSIFHPATAPLSLQWAAFPTDWAIQLFSSPTSPILISKLSTLEISIRNGATMPAWDLPGLRYLSINNLSNFDIPLLLPFLVINGSRLLGLSVWTTQRCSNLYKLIEHATALQSVVFDDLDLEALRPPHSPTYTSITHIGLTSIDYASHSDTRCVQRCLVYVLAEDLFPSLRTVRIMTDSIPDTLKKEWEAPIATASQYGIRLEDCKRRLLRYIRTERWM